MSEKVGSKETQKATLNYGRKNLYVAKNDHDIWLRAEEYANLRGLSISSVVAESLKRFLINGINYSRVSDIEQVLETAVNAIANGDYQQERCVEMARDAINVVNKLRAAAS